MSVNQPIHIPLTPLEPWIAQTIGVNRLERADLQRYQLLRLRETVQHARTHSPFYRQLLANAPATFESLNDLAQIPFTTPQDVRDNPLRFVCVSQDAIQRIVTLDSSGTTGEPKRIAFTSSDQQLTLDFFQVGMSTFTSTADTVLILLPAERPGSVGELLAATLSQHGIRAIAYGPIDHAQTVIELMQHEQISVLVGLPTQALLLARHPVGRTLKLKSVLLTADHVPNAIVAAVEYSWGCRVYQHYGMTEMGLGGGVECGAHRGYHLREADLLFEIIDPRSGQPRAAGEPGEVVFSTLTRTGMPLIRYRTGDLSRFLPGNCPCGTVLQTLAHVRQRLNGLVELGQSGSICMADLDEALFASDYVLNFSASLAHGNIGRLQIDLQLSSDHPADWRSDLEAALDRIPALQLASRAGVLVLLLSCSEAIGGAPARLTKRTIMIRESSVGQASASSTVCIPAAT